MKAYRTLSIKCWNSWRGSRTSSSGLAWRCISTACKVSPPGAYKKHLYGESVLFLPTWKSVSARWQRFAWVSVNLERKRKYPKLISQDKIYLNRNKQNITEVDVCRRVYVESSVSGSSRLACAFFFLGRCFRCFCAVIFILLVSSSLHVWSHNNEKCDIKIGDWLKFELQ